MRTVEPKLTPPPLRNAPPTGNSRPTSCAILMNWSSIPSQAPARGADAARWVSSMEPAIATRMNTAPPRRYSAAIWEGSPMRRRSQVARSSKACISISRNSDTAVNAMRYGSWSTVSAMFNSSTMPTTTTALSGRRCPKTA